MAEKTKSTVLKSTGKRMTISEMPKTRKASAPSNGPGARGSAALGLAQPPDSRRQLDAFETAMKLFHARKLTEAREKFQQAAGGPESDVAQRSRLHIAMCDRRLQQAAVQLQSAEDYYNYGVALINTRNLAEARAHLEKALQMAPGSDHVHYALALAQALSGDLQRAFQNLRNSIELEPRNRIMARQDADFAPLAGQPPFAALLYPEKKSW